MCDNYGQAGAINYYTKNKNLKAISFNADYIDWFHLPDTTINFIRVIEVEGRDAEFTKLSPYFSQAFIADSINNPFAREYKTTIIVFSHPKIDVNKRLKEEVVEKKKYE